MKIALMSLMSLAVLAGCKDSGIAIKDNEPASGVYQYKAFDPENQVVVVGTLTMTIDDEGRVTGNGPWKSKARLRKPDRR